MQKKKEPGTWPSTVVYDEDKDSGKCKKNKKGEGRTGIEPVTSGRRLVAKLQSYTLPLSYRPN